MQPTYITATDLAELLAPYVGARLTDPRDPRRDLPKVEFSVPGLNKFDPYIRAVDQTGISVFFYDRCETFPWADLKFLRIGNREYRISASARRAA